MAQSKPTLVTVPFGAIPERRRMANNMPIEKRSGEQKNLICFSSFCKLYFAEMRNFRFFNCKFREKVELIKNQPVSHVDLRFFSYSSMPIFIARASFSRIHENGPPLDFWPPRRRALRNERRKHTRAQIPALPVRCLR